MELYITLGSGVREVVRQTVLHTRPVASYEPSEESVLRQTTPAMD